MENQRIVYTYSKAGNNPKKSRVAVAGIINYTDGTVKVNSVKCPQNLFNKKFARRVAVERIHNNRDKTPTICKTFSDPKEAGNIFRELASNYIK